MWFKKKKKEREVIGRFSIPSDKMFEFCKLLDAKEGIYGEATHVANYNLWKFVVDVTGIDINDGKYGFGGNALNIEVVKYAD